MSDCIDRQAVLDILIWEEEPMQQIQKVRDLPSVTPTDDATLKDIFCMGCEYKEERTGHWIYTEYHTWCCSECGGNPHKGTGFVPNKDGMKMRWKYCNLCGAKMFEPHERSDKE